MMTGMPPPRFYNYEWQISRMTDKGFGESIQHIVAEMLRPHPNDRIETSKLVIQLEDAWNEWAATIEEGVQYVSDWELCSARELAGREVLF